MKRTRLELWIDGVIDRGQLAVHVLRGRPVMYRINVHAPMRFVGFDDVLIKQCFFDGGGMSEWLSHHLTWDGERWTWMAGTLNIESAPV